MLLHHSKIAGACLLAASALLLGSGTTSEASPTTETGILTWEEAYAKAERLVGMMTLEQRVNLTTGTGNEIGPCEGNTAPTTNPDFPVLCLNDGPLGLRHSLNTSAFVTAINAAASFDRALIRERGVFMGQEYRGKGVNVQLGPGMNMMRVMRSGRNWEYGSEDPYLTGVVAVETIKGVQSQGVVSEQIRK